MYKVYILYTGEVYQDNILAVIVIILLVICQLMRVLHIIFFLNLRYY